MRCGQHNCTGYHVCCRCILQAIDFKHPNTWPSVFLKAGNSTPCYMPETANMAPNRIFHGFEDYKLKYTRIFQFLDDADWFRRNKRLLDLATQPRQNRWNIFQQIYSCNVFKEPPQVQAVIYAASRDFVYSANKYADRNVDAVVPHSRMMWRALLDLSAEKSSMIHPIDVTKVQALRGESSIRKLLAIAALCDYNLMHYPQRPQVSVIRLGKGRTTRSSVEDSTSSDKPSWQMALKRASWKIYEAVDYLCTTIPFLGVGILATSVIALFLGTTIDRLKLLA